MPRVGGYVTSMARQEADREDLLREATALVERAELCVAGMAEPVVVGFRRDGAGSVYFGGDPVFQFNSLGELRRAFCGGRLLKAERGGMVALNRQRTATEVQLVRHELSAAETAAVLQTLAENVVHLRDALARGDYSVTGQVPPHADIVGRICDWLESLGETIRVARVPNVK